jgi:hypothetical protein
MFATAEPGLILLLLPDRWSPVTGRRFPISDLCYSRNTDLITPR